MTNVRVWMCAGLLVLAFPSAARAAEGVQTDAVADATEVHSIPDGAALKVVDVLEVHAAHDPQAGTLEFDLGGDVHGTGHSTLVLSARLSAPGDDGTCSTPGSPAVVVSGSESARGYLGPGRQEAILRDGAGEEITRGSYQTTDLSAGERDRPRLTFSSPALAGLDLRCVTDVSASKTYGGFTGQSTDAVDPFCLGPCPVKAVPAALEAADTTSTAAPVVAPPAVLSAPATAVEQSSNGVRAPALSLANAQRAATRALSARFGKAFARRSSSTYHLRCAVAGAQATCTVSWRARDAYYAGSLALAARRAGASTSVAVTRFTVQRLRNQAG